MIIKQNLEVRTLTKEDGIYVLSNCDSCKKRNVRLNLVGFSDNGIGLCDECLQELNRKIVDYLADKNI